jgi:hypothetical protein
MKTIPQLQLSRALRLRRTFLALLAGSLAAGLVATHAAPPSVQALLQGHNESGKSQNENNH